MACIERLKKPQTFTTSHQTKASMLKKLKDVIHNPNRVRVLPTLCTNTGIMRAAVTQHLALQTHLLSNARGKFFGSSKSEFGNYIFLRGFHENDLLLTQVPQPSPASIQRVAMLMNTKQISWTFDSPHQDDRTKPQHQPLRKRADPMPQQSGTRLRHWHQGCSLLCEALAVYSCRWVPQSPAHLLTFRTGLVQMCIAVSLQWPQQEGVCNYSHVEKPERFCGKE